MTAHWATPALYAPRCLLDFETRSRADLTEVGAYRYAADPSTQILCASFSFDDDITHLWMPWLEVDTEVEYEDKLTKKGFKEAIAAGETPCIETTPKGKQNYYVTRKQIIPQMVYAPDLVPIPEALIQFVLDGGTVEAHNAGFERAIWHYIMVQQLGAPPAKRWDDTMAVCAYRALPMSLDDVGDVLELSTQKDKRGKEILRKISQPQKITKKNRLEWNNDPQLFRDCGDYCITDNKTERALGKKIGRLPPSEYRLWVLDQTINTRGVRLDLDAVNAAKAIVEKATVNMESELTAITKGEITTGNQRERIIKWLDEKHHIKLPNTQKGTIKETLKDKGLPEEARRVIEIRQELSRTSTGKLYTMLECVGYDGRVRGMLAYHGAGTGRWAGRLVQPQNFPRPKVNGKPFKGNIEDLIAIILYEDPATLKLCYGPEMETLAAALRGMFISAEGKELLTSDFSSIEARIVLWLAGQDDAMTIFEKADAKTGPDIYCHLASQIYGRAIDKNKDADERQLGKIGVLGCGYQMGAERLQEQAHDEYELDLDLDLCKRIVTTYRETYYKVKFFWKDINNAACNTVITGKPHTHRGITYEIVNDAAGKWLACRLPSGRRIWYYNPSTTMEHMPWSTKEKPDIRPKLWYEGRDNKHGGVWTTISTYGGMLTENIVQAIARDLMADAMIRAEQAGYTIILTVHDEIVAEVPIGWGSQKEFDEIMAVIPPWAKGMPIAVEGWRGPRYRK